MTQLGLFDEPVAYAKTVTEQALTVTNAPEKSGNHYIRGTQARPPEKSEKLTASRLVTLNGRDYRHHRDCGEFVWLAALDAGIGGPFYWVKAEELRPKASLSVSIASQSDRVRAAQKRLASLPLNGPEYMDALGEMARAMGEGRS